MVRMSVWCLCAVLLSGCAESAVTHQAALSAALSKEDLQAAKLELISWKLDDLAAATARATKANHQAGMLCYPTLAKYVQQGQTLGEGLKFAGVWDGFEAGLLLAKGIGGAQTNPAVEDIVAHCGGLVTEARLVLIRLGLIGAGTSMGVPGLGAILPR